MLPHIQNPLFQNLHSFCERSKNISMSHGSTNVPLYLPNESIDTSILHSSIYLPFDLPLCLHQPNKLYIEISISSTRSLSIYLLVFFVFLSVNLCACLSIFLSISLCRDLKCPQFTYKHNYSVK